MIVIGERINASNKSVGEAIIKRDSVYITRLAQAQIEAGQGGGAGGGNATIGAAPTGAGRQDRRGRTPSGPTGLTQALGQMLKS